MYRKPLALAAALVAVALQAPTAHAAPALAGTFDVSGMPQRITVGNDGTVWFGITGSGDSKEFGRITPSGQEQEFDSPNDQPLVGLTTGPDGNIWATQSGFIVKIPPSDPAQPVAFSDSALTATGGDITVGPDGHLWVGSGAHVVEIDPAHPGASGGGTDEDHLGILSGTDPRGIAAGGDGNLWIIDNNVSPDDSAIVRFDTAGNVIGTPTKPGQTLAQAQIVAGPTGQLAFTQSNSTPQRIGRIDFSTHIDFTDMPNGVGDPTGIVFGNDGAYWTADFGNNKLGRLTPSGDFTEPVSFTGTPGPRRLAKGANDTLWVSLEQGQKIAKITGVSAPPPGGGNNPPPRKDTTAPTLSSLRLSNRSFLVGSQLATFSRKRTPIGTTISFRVSENSTTTFTFAFRAKGFKSGKKCVAHKPRGKRRAKRCTRVAGRLSHSTPAGARKLEFEGRFSKHRKLKPGRYRLSVRSTDAAGNKSTARRASFRLLKR